MFIDPHTFDHTAWLSSSSSAALSICGVLLVLDAVQANPSPCIAHPASLVDVYVVWSSRALPAVTASSPVPPQG